MFRRAPLLLTTVAATLALFVGAQARSSAGDYVTSSGYANTPTVGGVAVNVSASNFGTGLNGYVTLSAGTFYAYGTVTGVVPDGQGGAYVTTAPLAVYDYLRGVRFASGVVVHVAPRGAGFTVHTNDSLPAIWAPETTFTWGGSSYYHW